MRRDDIIIQAFNFLKIKDYNAARNFVSLHYPKISPKNKPLVLEATALGFTTAPITISARSNINHNRKTFSEIEKDSLFLSDFYQCRYSRLKLFAPPVLTIISLYLDEVFPCFKIPHFPLDRNHQGMYTLYPSPDHAVSLYAGGSNENANLVTSSSSLNMVKSQYSHVEMGWRIIDRSELDMDWDGGRSWFLELINDKEEFEQLIAKSVKLQTFHKKIDPASYFNKWALAFRGNNQSVDTLQNNHLKNAIDSKSNISNHSSLLRGDSDLQKEITMPLKISDDIKSLPVGSICTNKRTNNTYVCLKKKANGMEIFSLDENITMNILTKPLLVNVEFLPKLGVLSVVELPANIFTIEQLELIKIACKRWCNGSFNTLSDVELPQNTVYHYLLTNS